MGVYIEGMKMPESCEMCPIEGCEYINKKFTCPLIEIDIVRCGECKHQIKQWHEDNRMKSKGFYYYHCDRNEDPFVAHTVNGEPTDFCSYGERRTDEFNT